MRSYSNIGGNFHIDSEIEHHMTKGGTTRRARANDPMKNQYIYRSKYYRYYYTQLEKMMLALFKYSNLPENADIDLNLLEMTLIYDGAVVIAEDKNDGTLSNFRLGATMGEYDKYQRPITYEVLANNYIDIKTRSNSVIIYNDNVKSGSYWVIKMLAFKLAEYDLAISQNVRAQSSSVLITGPESAKRDILEAYDRMQAWAPVIVGDSKLKEDISFSALNTTTPFTADKIHDLKVKAWDEGMMHLGIDVAAKDKSTQMSIEEVNSNEGQVNLFREALLNARVEGINKVNKMFGTEIKVEFNNGVYDELSELFQLSKIIEYRTEAAKNQAEANLKNAQAQTELEGGEE